MQVEVGEPDVIHQQLIENLFVFYRYDLMPYIDDGEPGAYVNRFGTINGETSRTHEEATIGDSYWAKPGVILPLPIFADGRPGGVVVVVTPPHTSNDVDYRISSFFILNKVRRQGVGTRAATLVFDRYRGRWEVPLILPQNEPSNRFWKHVVEAYTGQDFTEGTLKVDKQVMPRLIFDNTVGKI